MSRNELFAMNGIVGCRVTAFANVGLSWIGVQFFEQLGEIWCRTVCRKKDDTHRGCSRWNLCMVTCVVLAVPFGMSDRTLVRVFASVWGGPYGCQ